MKTLYLCNVGRGSSGLSRPDAVRNARLLHLIVRAMNASSFKSTDGQSQGIDPLRDELRPALD